jgi:hypothetical protein
MARIAHGSHHKSLAEKIAQAPLDEYPDAFHTLMVRFIGEIDIDISAHLGHKATSDFIAQRFEYLVQQLDFFVQAMFKMLQCRSIPMTGHDDEVYTLSKLNLFYFWDALEALINSTETIFLTMESSQSILRKILKTRRASLRFWDAFEKTLGDDGTEFIPFYATKLSIARAQVTQLEAKLQQPNHKRTQRNSNSIRSTPSSNDSTGAFNARAKTVASMASPRDISLHKTRGSTTPPQGVTSSATLSSFGALQRPKDSSE